jgi:hypothetical protein
VQALKSRRLARYRWPLVITLAIAVTAAFSLSPLVDAGRPAAPLSATLQTSPLYDLLAPVSNALDALTFLSPRQYWATFALCAVFFFGPGILRDLRRPRRFSPTATILSVARFAGGVVAVIGVMLVATRPMASLSLSDPDLVAVDFHSHTEASHDGRPGFDAERNRAWHRSSGFDVAYVTDHNAIGGALSGMARNPIRSGDATVLLPGIELRDRDEHVILIGIDPRRMDVTSPDWHGAAEAADGQSVPPLLLLSMPGNSTTIPSDELQDPIRLAGIELSDGSPRGLAQTGTDRRAILAAAARFRLALVSASDNHGWGRAAPAWSVLRIPGWREMAPVQLDLAIRRTILARGQASVQVIARRIAAQPTGRVEAGLSGLGVALLMMRTMNLRERFSWIAWSWGLGLISLRRARNNRKRLRARLRETMRHRVRRPLIEAAAAMQAAS